MSPRHAFVSLAALAALAATAAVSYATASNQDVDGAAAELKHFPETLKGYQRLVLQLPEKANEADLKVEIVPGRMAEVDCNHASYGTETATRTVDGFGYSYFVVTWDGRQRTTLKACPPDSKHTAFVQGTGTLVDYNSRLPLVVFVPDTFKARYRIWSAGEDADMPVMGTLATEAGVGRTDAKAKDLSNSKGGHQSVKSTQVKGTKVIRKQDKHGNRINFSQSD